MPCLMYVKMKKERKRIKCVYGMVEWFSSIMEEGSGADFGSVYNPVTDRRWVERPNTSAAALQSRKLEPPQLLNILRKVRRESMRTERMRSRFLIRLCCC